MTVKQFDTGQGQYHFELSDFVTEFHSHPTIEVLLATQGTFSIKSKAKEWQAIQMAVVDRNLAHQVNASNCQLTVLMFEPHLRSPDFDVMGIPLSEGIFAQSILENPEEQIEKLIEHTEIKKASNLDPRVLTCLSYLQQHTPDYAELIDKLQDLVHLSESRLSHLFSQEMGLSLKKYLVWTRLRTCISLVLHQNESLFGAALTAGFYDQAHLSRAFKEMLGMPPSQAYNSRTLQE